MDVRNCSRCGKVFSYAGKPLCRRCLDLEEREFERVKAYLVEHPGSTIEEVHEDTEVSKDKILRFLREGRLIATEGLADVLRCEWCQRPIQTGYRCKKCAEGMQSQIRSVLPAEPQREAADSEDRMYTSNLIRDRRDR